MDIKLGELLKWSDGSNITAEGIYNLVSILNNANKNPNAFKIFL